MSLSNIKKVKAPGVLSDINVTPMVDVMLVMLIIFMVITPMLSKGFSVNLVKTKNPIAMQAADKDDAVLISITRDGKVYLQSNPIPPDDLPSKVKDMLTNRLDKTCYIKADQRAKYDLVVKVIDNLRAAGVDQVGLLTDKPNDTESAPAKPATGI